METIKWMSPFCDAVEELKGPVDEAVEEIDSKGYRLLSVTTMRVTKKPLPPKYYAVVEFDDGPVGRWN